MKEIYWRKENIKEIALEMKQSLPSITRNQKKVSFDIDNSALLVLDMQNYFLNPDSHAFVPGSEAIIPGLNQLITLYDKHDRPVIYTRHINNTENAASMATWWKDLIIDDEKSEIDSRIVINGDTLVKPQYDAFYNTELDKILKENGVSQVIICGVMTHLCCETTARSAFVHGCDVIFPIDASATYNKDFHLATLLNLSHGFARISTVNELLGLENE